MRAAAENEPELVDAVLDSMSPVKIVITDVIRRLNLKGRYFEDYSAASMEAIEEIWDSLHSIDTSLKFGDKYQPYLLTLHRRISSTIAANNGTTHFFCQKVW